ncbi:hypothetical protein BDU57DRAFT_512629 [Ampelomyces quisqualis]|uniref:Uncharacterized protein n=1 Tax=Ampelomyces quisqualis TaxID=50730 RepID=A0A6A5QUV5_AMPQU|nr:hypothetical protein BDU57DRAFT_512629 [Ampelomyces quisqualis]
MTLRIELMFPSTECGSPQPKFRLLDLPIELRLRIPEYELAQDASLRWQWSTCKSEKKVGSFQGIHELTALSHVSRQIYPEASNIVYKVNTVAFQRSGFGNAFRASDSGLSYMQTIRKMIDASMTYHFFIRQVSFTTRKNMKTIIFNVLLLPTTENIPFHLQVISELARLTLYARIVVQATNWTVHRFALPGLPGSSARILRD